MHQRLPVALAAVILLTAVSSRAGHRIPYPPGMKLGGAAGYLGTVDQTPSPYFKHLNVFSLGNNRSRVILPRFKTYQQTTEYTCGPAALVMAADYRGVRLNELEVAAAAGTTEETGTSTEQVVQYLKSHGWAVRFELPFEQDVNPFVALCVAPLG